MNDIFNKEKLIQYVVEVNLHYKRYKEKIINTIRKQK